MKVKFKLAGEKELVARLRSLADGMPEKARAALYRQGEFIMTRSKELFVPVVTGDLKNSGIVRVSDKGKQLGVELVYGGSSASYAVTVHERQGPYHPDGRGPKYLERPLMEAVKDLLPNLAKDLALG